MFPDLGFLFYQSLEDFELVLDLLILHMFPDLGFLFYQSLEDFELVLP